MAPQPAASADVNEQTQCLLFTLPGEIRNVIYGLVLTSPQKKTAIKLCVLSPSTTLSILLTCRRIHNEAVGIFYSTNHLAIAWDDLVPVGSFGFRNLVTRLSPRRLDAIFQLSVTVYHPCQIPGTVGAVGSCPSLRELHVLQVDLYQNWAVPQQFYTSFEEVTDRVSAAAQDLPASLETIKYSLVTDAPEMEFWGGLGTDNTKRGWKEAEQKIRGYLVGCSRSSGSATEGTIEAQL